MDFEVSEEMETMLGMVRSFMDAEVVPLEGEMCTATERVGRGWPRRSARSTRWGCGRPITRWSSGALVCMVDHGLVSGALGRSPLGHTSSARGARRRQRRDPARSRHRGAERAVPAPLARARSAAASR